MGISCCLVIIKTVITGIHYTQSYLLIFHIVNRIVKMAFLENILLVVTDSTDI